MEPRLRVLPGALAGGGGGEGVPPDITWFVVPVPYQEAPVGLEVYVKGGEDVGDPPDPPEPPLVPDGI